MKINWTKYVGLYVIFSTYEHLLGLELNFIETMLIILGIFLISLQDVQNE